MSTLASTLEEAQVQILQGDLSKNLGLQPSVIPAKDKELKTKAKKIIPAINELVKLIDVLNNTVTDYSSNVQSLVDSAEGALLQSLADQIELLKSGMKTEISKELLQSINQYVKATMSTQFDQLIGDRMQNFFDESITAAINTRFTVLEEKVAAVVDEKIADYYQSIVLPYIDEHCQSGNRSGDGEMKRIFKSKFRIGQSSVATLPWKFSEIKDINKQIVIMVYSSASQKYVFVESPYQYKNDSTSLYNTFDTPADLRVDDNDVAEIQNRGNGTMIVYCYDLIE